MDPGAIKAGQAYVEITAEDAALRKGLADAQQQLQAFKTGVSAMKGIGTGMMVAGGSVLAGLGFSTKVFAEFQDVMKGVQAVSGASGAAFDGLTTRAEQLGAAMSYTSSEVAGAMLNLARAGFSTDEIQASIQGMLNLARPTGTDLAQSADIAAGTLRAFNLEAGQMTRVADVLVATANNSAQKLEDLGEIGRASCRERV